MRARGYNKRVDIYENTAVSDGYGGNTVTTAKIGTSWAKIETFKVNGRNSAITDFGILDANNAITITLRKRNDITYDVKTHYFVYRDEKYIIKSFPVNNNFEDSVIQMICVKAND